MTIQPVNDGGGAPGTRGARRLVQLAGFVFYLLAVQGLFTAGVGAHVYLKGGSAHDLWLPVMGGALAICYVLVGFYLRRYRTSARNFAFAFAAVGLFFFPIGTLLGALIVVCIDRANRAGVFPPRTIQPSAPAAATFDVEDALPVLRFEPDLTAEQAG